MNTDPSRPGETPADEPVVDGAGLRPVEDRLRRSLEAEARTITPTDRLGAILDEGARAARALHAAGASVRRAPAADTTAGSCRLPRPRPPCWWRARVGRQPVPRHRPPPVAATPTAVGTAEHPARRPRRRRAERSSVADADRQPQPSTPAPTATTTGARLRRRRPSACPSTTSVRSRRGAHRSASSGSSSPPGCRRPRSRRATRWPRCVWPWGRHRSRQPYQLRLDRRHRRVGGGRGRRHHRAASPRARRTDSAGRGAAGVDGRRRRSAPSLPVRFELADGGADVSPGHPASTSYTRPERPDRGARPGRSDLGRRAGAGLGRQGRRPPHRLGCRQHLRGERPVAAPARREGRRPAASPPPRRVPPPGVRTRSRRSSR